MKKIEALLIKGFEDQLEKNLMGFGGALSLSLSLVFLDT